MAVRDTRISTFIVTSQDPPESTSGECAGAATDCDPHTCQRSGAFRKSDRDYVVFVLDNSLVVINSAWCTQN